MAITATVGGLTSNSYVTLLEFQAWRELYYGVDGTEDDLSDEFNLMKSRRYIDQAYIWMGRRLTAAQPLQWPRYVNRFVDGFQVSSETIPQAVKDAQCEMAYLIQGGATPFAAIENSAVLRKREKVDVIEEDTTYAGGGRERPAYPLIDALVAPYVERKRGTSAGSVPLQRA